MRCHQYNVVVYAEKKQIDLNEYCPCCGFDKVNYSICPVCFWEDASLQFDGSDMEGDTNRVSLFTVQIIMKILVLVRKIWLKM